MALRVAVLSLTRDRLAYTQHCFQTLKDNAGCDYDHYVVDQASEDGTVEWLNEQDDLDVIFASENIGICPGLNVLLEQSCDASAYDVIVRFDNDCEVLQPDTLRVVCEEAFEQGIIAAPRVLGLNNPPPVLRSDDDLDETAVLGGIFMAIPATAFSVGGYRYDETFPLWEGDEAICGWWRAAGGTVGYLRGWTVNHYLTTSGQHADIPDYFQRTRNEGKVAL